MVDKYIPKIAKYAIIIRSQRLHRLRAAQNNCTLNVVGAIKSKLYHSESKMRLFPAILYIYPKLMSILRIETHSFVPSEHWKFAANWSFHIGLNGFNIVLRRLIPHQWLKLTPLVAFAPMELGGSHTCSLGSCRFLLKENMSFTQSLSA